MIRPIYRPRQTRRLLWPALLLTLLSSYLFAGHVAAETGDHHQAYLEALDTVMTAEARIEREMDRISNGSVAHYDFLQHEHIELLRHASALRHPPLSMPVNERDDIVAQANVLLMAAKSLELVIADYLQAEAQLRSALNNTFDLAAMGIKQSQTTSATRQLQFLAQAAESMRSENTSQSRVVLYMAFDKVAALEIDQAWFSELLMQGSLIRSNLSADLSGPDQLAKAGITALAEELRLSYVAATGG